MGRNILTVSRQSGTAPDIGAFIAIQDDPRRWTRSALSGQLSGWSPHSRYVRNNWRRVVIRQFMQCLAYIQRITQPKAATGILVEQSLRVDLPTQRARYDLRSAR